MATRSLGPVIKRARERRRWTQRQLASALGVSVKTIDNWENDRTEPRSSAGALEEVLGIDLNGPQPPSDSDAEALEKLERDAELLREQIRLLRERMKSERLRLRLDHGKEKDEEARRRAG